MEAHAVQKNCNASLLGREGSEVGRDGGKVAERVK